MADERDLLELCRNLCRPERDAVLIQLEADDPAAAQRIRHQLQATTEPQPQAVTEP